MGEIKGLDDLRIGEILDELRASIARFSEALEEVARLYEERARRARER